MDGRRAERRDESADPPGERVATNHERYRSAEARLWASFGGAPTERSLRLERIGTTVRVQELGEGPPVVFVHGGSISGASWAPLVALLPDFRCIVLDRPGCGLSAPLSAPFGDIEQFGIFADALVVDVLDALGLDTANVAGTSFGGYLTLRAAAAHPDRIDRLIEFGWPIGAPIAHTPVVMRIAASRTLGRLAMTVPPTERAVRAMLRQIGLGQALDAGRFPQEAIDWMLALLRDTNTMRNEIDAGPRLIHPFRGLNRELVLAASLLATITAPTYFLWGAEDPFGGAEVARGFVAHLPDAALELVPNAGHAVWMDDPERAADTTRTFLSAPQPNRQAPNRQPQPNL